MCQSRLGPRNPDTSLLDVRGCRSIPYPGGPSQRLLEALRQCPITGKLRRSASRLPSSSSIMSWSADNSSASAIASSSSASSFASCASMATVGERISIQLGGCFIHSCTFSGARDRISPSFTARGSMTRPYSFGFNKNEVVDGRSIGNNDHPPRRSPEAGVCCRLARTRSAVSRSLAASSSE
jgi:hypothetical protein